TCSPTSSARTGRWRPRAGARSARPAWRSSTCSESPENKPPRQAGSRVPRSASKALKNSQTGEASAVGGRHLWGRRAGAGEQHEARLPRALGPEEEVEEAVAVEVRGLRD